MARIACSRWTTCMRYAMTNPKRWSTSYCAVPRRTCISASRVARSRRGSTVASLVFDGRCEVIADRRSALRQAGDRRLLQRGNALGSLGPSRRVPGWPIALRMLRNARGYAGETAQAGMGYLAGSLGRELDRHAPLAGPVPQVPGVWCSPLASWTGSIAKSSTSWPASVPSTSSDRYRGWTASRSRSATTTTCCSCIR